MIALLRRGGRLLWVRLPIVASVVGLLALLELMVQVGSGRILSSPSFGPLMFGRVPLEIVGSVWFVALLAAELSAVRPADGEPERLPFYRFALSIVGLALVVWAGAAKQGRAVPVEYLIAAAAIVVVFGYAGWTNTSGVFRTLRHVLPDFAAFARQPTTWAAAAIALALMTWGQKEVKTEPVRSGAEFEKWFLAQPRLPFPAAVESAPVVIAEFIDYQCPFCREASRRYDALFREIRQAHPDSVKFLRFDFPLEKECNGAKGMKNVHPAACEAAVAVRLARSAGKEAAMEAWLWAHQSALSRDSIFEQLRTVTGITDAAARYPAELEHVKAEARIGQQVPVAATPTFWVNGVLLSGVSERSFRWVIMRELSAGQRSVTSRCRSDCEGRIEGRLAGSPSAGRSSILTLTLFRPSDR